MVFGYFPLESPLCRRIFVNCLVLTVVGLCFAIPAFSQVEDFDSLTPPALPEDWSSSASGSGAPLRFVSTDAFSDTPPNSLFADGYSSVNRTDLHSPQFFVPRVPTQLIFRHRHQLEHGPGVNFDGAQLFFVPGFLGGYGPDFEWTVQGGSFSQGGYGGTVSASFQNQIGGQQAWVGDQLLFSTVVANLPANVAAKTAQFSWALFSDNSVKSAGWWIDSIMVSPAADLQVTQQASLKPAYLGASLTVVTSVVNTSATLATNVNLKQTLPQDVELLSLSSSSGSAVANGKLLTALFLVISSGGSQTLTATVRLPQQVSKAVYLENALGDRILRRAYALRHLPFSPPPVKGSVAAGAVITFDFFPPTNDACQSQAIGSAGVGKIGITVRGSCSLETKIKNMQNAGEIAAIIIDDTDDPTPSGGSSAGLTIPAFLARAGDLEFLSQIASYGLEVSLTALNDSLHFAAEALGDQFDPNPLNNFHSLNVPVQPDTRQAEFAAKLAQAQKALKALKITPSKKAKLVVKAKALELKGLMQTIVQESLVIADLMGSSKIVPAVKAAERLVRKAAALKSRTFGSDKKKAAASLKKAYKLSIAGL